jgi:transcriptional regulator with XRE-family HTH domain
MEDVHFLQKRRQELGLSQNDLELRLKHRGVRLSRKAISAWERGKRDPEFDGAALKALAEALRWDLETLLGVLKGSK